MFNLILSYAIKITVSTLLIYLSIRIVEPGNYRNKLSNALATAIILSFAGSMPIFFFFGLVAWIYILINYYSIGFFKSFLCVVVYAVLFILMNIGLTAMLLTGGAVYSSVNRPRATESREQSDPISGIMNTVRNKLGLEAENTREKPARAPVRALAPSEKPAAAPDTSPARKKVKIYLSNGGTISGSIKMSGEKGYILDIADGGSEVLIRKEDVTRIQEL